MIVKSMVFGAPPLKYMTYDIDNLEDQVNMYGEKNNHSYLTFEGFI